MRKKAVGHLLECKQTARVAGEFYLNAINVMRGAEAISTYAPIPESEKFRIEYWELEEAKLRRRPRPKPLAGRVALVTGGGSGIGRATALRLAAEGACVVVADRDGAAAAAATALLDVRTRTWATGLMKRAGIRPGLFPALRQPGEVIGPVRPDGIPGGGALPLIAVGSHDTASAVAAVPANGPDFAFISSGTWSLVGMELGAPVLTEASRQGNFTNEADLDGTVRYLRNVAGLWLLQECLRHWAGQAGRPGKPGAGQSGAALAAVLRAAAAVEPLRFVIDAEDPAAARRAGLE